MMMKYYQRELSRLHDLGADFSKAHPALAPMLSSADSDPDVERLLEGTAFLSALIHEKLDDELPEVLYPLLQAVAPHYLRPIPAATLIRFTPKRALREVLRIPRGTAIHSVPVEGTACVFTTCRDVTLLPLQIENVTWWLHGKGKASLRVVLNSGIPLESLPADCLRFSCAGSYVDASLRFMALKNCTREIRFVPESGGAITRVSSLGLVAEGFAKEEAIIPYPAASFGGFRHIQEYFMLPEQFCSFSVSGLEQWTDRGTGNVWSLEFDLEDVPDNCPDFKGESLQLFVTPAVNLFPHDGEPLVLDHKVSAYCVRPATHTKAHYQVYSVDRVRGVTQGSMAGRDYTPFMASSPSQNMATVYSLTPQTSPLSGVMELWLSVAYSSEDTLMPEVLSLALQCTNGELPLSLRAGDICMPSSTSPELAEFTNLRAPTAPVQPPLGEAVLWRLLSHLFLNLLSIADTKKIQSLLDLYLFTKTKDRGGLLANKNKIKGLEDVQVTDDERFVRDHLMRGRHVHLVLNRDSYAGEGDMYIFCSVLDRFFSTYASVNTYTRLTATDTLHRNEYQWPERLGQRLLL